MTETIRTENIDIVLVEPRNHGNVGAAARALYNMGLDHLVLVGWRDDVEARRIAFEWATDGEGVLQSARRCDSLDEAIAGAALAIATSARLGADRPPPIAKAELGPVLARWTPNNRVAIVFGPERTGLRREHLALCSNTLILPVAKGRKSLNLAQAVLLTAYEILMAAGAPVEADQRRTGPLDGVATREERQRLYRHAVEALEAVDFLNPNRPIQPLHDIGYLLDRAGATAHEVRILHGILRNILCKVKSRITNRTDRTNLHE
jgi:TrmH family RNA methyltransferase